MDKPPVLGPAEKLSEIRLARIARRLLRELTEHDRELATNVLKRGLRLNG